MKKKIKPWLVITLCLFSLGAILSVFSQKQLLQSLAQGKKASLQIDTQAVMGDLHRPWQNLAQGGEEKENLLNPIIDKVKVLNPNYIRIDHIFDYYDVLQIKDQQVTYDFSKLDQVVTDVLETGAKPFFSLSFMPPALNPTDLVGSPQNWQQWSDLVQKTIQHYSGYLEKNIKDVYYEVWNEPDLFGNWKTTGEKNYLDLYFYSAQGAKKTVLTNSYKIGGPATTGFYPNWARKLILFCQENNLPLDFISWHRFDSDPNRFLKDIKQANQVIKTTLGNQHLEKVISEWGSNPENHPWHDQNFDAAHEIAILRTILGRITLAFSFEIKDGLPPPGKQLWGRWGLLTHHTVGAAPKPRYISHLFLSKLEGHRLYLKGEGTWVKGIAAKSKQKTTLLVTNYDLHEKHQETFPIEFINLKNGPYLLTTTKLDNQPKEEKIFVQDSSYQASFSLGPNEVLLIELVAILPQG
ncbi:hypothetical protein ACFLZP_02660 [Patescibacteria group bacterium]